MTKDDINELSKNLEILSIELVLEKKPNLNRIMWVLHKLLRFYHQKVDESVKNLHFKGNGDGND